MIVPVSAEAATVADEPMKISEFALPSRPLKLRFALVITTSPSPVTRCPVMFTQVPQPASSTEAPA
ncbi:hypothetical protein D3C83_69560 [compost metagenome]